MNRTRLARTWGAFALAVPLLAVTACSGADASGGASDGVTTVKLLSYSGTAISWLGYLADKEGFFADNGISAEFTELPSGQQAASALIGGSVDITILDPGNAGPLLTQGQGLTLLVNGVTNYWTMVGGADADPSDLGATLDSLDGAVVSAPSTGGSGARMLHVLTDAYGLPRDQFEVVADPTNATLTSGTAAAVMTDTIGACRLNALGYTTVMNFIDPPESASSYPEGVQDLIGLAGLGFWTTPEWAQAHPDAVSGFQKAIEETTAWIQDPANADELAATMRDSDYNVPDLDDAQWADCVTQIAAAYNNSFSQQDADEWSSILQSVDGIPALPATSEWFADGLPQQ